MRTQITCPNCQTAYATEVHQVIDVGQHPELKQLLLSGQLNMAVCPRCGAAGQLTTPLAYHDPAHDLFMIFMPMELNMGQMEREKLIGELTQRAMNEIPPEQRRAYMLQPQQILSMQTFMEKVLETEGVTPEMIARQRGQAELLRTLLATDDKQEINRLLEERAGEIDETFMAMLKQSIEMVSQGGNESEMLKLINLQAKLYRETEVGRRLERQQSALHKFSQEARKDGLSPELLARHIIANADDEDVVGSLAMSGYQAMTYDFFHTITDEIDRLRGAGETEAAEQLAEIRKELVTLQRDIRQQSEEVLKQADALLRQIVRAPDTEEAVRENLNRIDEAFLYMLEARLGQATEEGDTSRAATLERIQNILQHEMEQQIPPEVRLLNTLLQADTEAEQERLLEENAGQITPQILQLLRSVGEQVQEREQAGLDGERIERLQELIEARL